MTLWCSPLWLASVIVGSYISLTPAFSVWNIVVAALIILLVMVVYAFFNIIFCLLYVDVLYKHTEMWDDTVGESYPRIYFSVISKFRRFLIRRDERLVEDIMSQ